MRVGNGDKRSLDRLWVDCPLVDGVTAQQWMVHNGRFPPEAVLEIARQMAAGLAACEHAEVVHGDLSAGQLWLSRAIRQEWLRASAHARTAWRSCGRSRDSRMPTSIRRRTTASRPNAFATERRRPSRRIYLHAAVCGGICSPVGRRLRARRRWPKCAASLSGRILDVRELAPDTPQPLAEMIAACMKRDPQARPQSFAVVAERLGPPTRQGAAALARCLLEGSRPLAISKPQPGIRPLATGAVAAGFRFNFVSPSHAGPHAAANGTGCDWWRY